MPSRRLLPLAVLSFVLMATEGSVGDWSGTYLARSGVDPDATAAAYAAFSLLMITGRIVGDGIVGAAGSRATVGFGALLAGAGLAISAAWPGLAGGIVGFGLVGAGLANVVPVLFSVAGRVGSSPAVGVASAATAGYAGLLIGPVVIGAVASGVGLRRRSSCWRALRCFRLCLLRREPEAFASSDGRRAPYSYPIFCQGVQEGGWHAAASLPYHAPLSPGKGPAGCDRHDAPGNRHGPRAHRSKLFHPDLARYEGLSPAAGAANVSSKAHVQRGSRRSGRLPGSAGPRRLSRLNCNLFVGMRENSNQGISTEPRLCVTTR